MALRKRFYSQADYFEFIQLHFSNDQLEVWSARKVVTQLYLSKLL